MKKEEMLFITFLSMFPMIYTASLFSEWFGQSDFSCFCGLCVGAVLSLLVLLPLEHYFKKFLNKLKKK